MFTTYRRTKANAIVISYSDTVLITITLLTIDIYTIVAPLRGILSSPALALPWPPRFTLDMGKQLSLWQKGVNACTSPGC